MSARADGFFFSLLAWLQQLSLMPRRISVMGALTDVAVACVSMVPGDCCSDMALILKHRLCICSIRCTSNSSSRTLQMIAVYISHLSFLKWLRAFWADTSNSRLKKRKPLDPDSSLTRVDVAVVTLEH